jgi:transcriptional regulator with XRE-family HTH domain
MGQAAGEELAAYLRSLKGGTGRSYDALARRLGVSSSALHRYCSGEGLPQRFGVLERFAIECGASRAEVTELHRLWAAVAAAADPPPAYVAPGQAASAGVARSAVYEKVDRYDGPGPADAVPGQTGAVVPGPHDIDGPIRGRRRRVRVAARWALIPVSLLAAAAALYVADTWRDGTATADGAATGPQACTTRASGVEHRDEQLGARVWTADVVCHNDVNAPLYLTPDSAQRIGVMDTPKSWFVCWLPGRVQADSGRVWYYTRGDRSEPGTQRLQAWGFMASEHVNATHHPWPTLPRCDFAAGALAQR